MRNCRLWALGLGGEACISRTVGSLVFMKDSIAPMPRGVYADLEEPMISDMYKEAYEAYQEAQEKADALFRDFGDSSIATVAQERSNRLWETYFFLTEGQHFIDEARD